MMKKRKLAQVQPNLNRAAQFDPLVDRELLRQSHKYNFDLEYSLALPNS